MTTMTTAQLIAIQDSTNGIFEQPFAALSYITPVDFDEQAAKLGWRFTVVRTDGSIAVIGEIATTEALKGNGILTISRERPSAPNYLEFLGYEEPEENTREFRHVKLVEPYSHRI